MLLGAASNWKLTPELLRVAEEKSDVVVSMPMQSR